MRRSQIVTCVTVLAVGSAANQAWPLSPLSTAITYQGQLKQSGVPIKGTADFEFTLWDAETGGAMAGAMDPHPGVDVVNGLFTVQLDFGAAAFAGDARWLEIIVTYPVGGSPVMLTPRQPITPAPYALALPGLRTEPSTDAAFPEGPIVIGGFSGNSTTNGVVAATIGGGGIPDFPNRALGDFSTVSGGAGNTASEPTSTVGGGGLNTASGDASTVGGGDSNTASGSQTTVGGGADNMASGDGGTIGGGESNVASGDKSAVGGGEQNTASGYTASVPGGSYNEASGTYPFAAGQRAHAIYEGSFVWSDSTTTDPDLFRSTGVDQFLIKATGGVGINTDAPGAALHIGGEAGVDGLMFPDGTLQTTASAGGGSRLWTASADDIFYNAGDVGVGTSSPGARLHVIEPVGFAVLGECLGEGTHGYLGHEHAGVFGEVDSPTGHACWFEGRGYFSGNVGLGVVSPSAKLHIGGTAGADGLMFPDGSLQTTAAVGGGGGSLWTASGADIFYTAGKVGIGTSSPQGKLHLAGANANLLMYENGGSPFLAVGDTTTTVGWLQWSSANDELDLYTYGHNYPISIGPTGSGGVFVDTGANDGNVGIGTTAPSSKLHVAGDSRFEGNIGIGIAPTAFAEVQIATDTLVGIKASTSFSLAGAAVMGEATSPTGEVYGVYGQATSPDGAGVYGESPGTGVRGVASATSGTNHGVHGSTNSAVGYAGYFEGGRNYFEGRVGIGTDSPDYPLHVTTANGSALLARSTDGSGISYAVYGQVSSTSGVGVVGSALSPGGVTSGGTFESWSNEGSGVVGHALAETGTTYGGRFETDSEEGRAVYGLATAATNSASFGGWFESGSRDGIGVYGHSTGPASVGVLGDAATPYGYDFLARGYGIDYGSLSSRRWKNNITPIGSPLDMLSRLRGVYFDWDEKRGGHHDVGMIAEEVGKVLPEIVNYEENGIDAVGMDYSKTTPLLVAAVNALRAEKDAEIRSLQDRNQELTRRVERLEAILAKWAGSGNGGE